MATIQATIDRSSSLPSRVRIALRKAMEEEGRASAARMRAKFVQWPSKPPPGFLNSRRGDLKGGIGSIVSQGPDSTSVLTGVISPRDHLQMVAHVQEYGQKDIVPVRCQQLAIPHTNVLDSRGVRRYATVFEASRDFVTYPTATQIRGWPGGGQPSRILYIRKPSVTVPPRPFVNPDLPILSERVVDRARAVIAAEIF